MEFLKEKIIVIIIIIVCVVSLGGAFLLFNKKEEPNEIALEPMIEEEVKEEKNLKNYFFVEIKGAVKKPGVYEVEEGAIINELIKIAGGVNKNAYTKNINLSKKLKEEMVVFVFTKSEYKSKKKENVLESKEEENKTIASIKPTEDVCSSDIYNIDECINEGESVIEASDEITHEDSSLKEEPTNSKVNINKASVEVLTNISGIGEKKAMAIVEYRNSNGEFKTVEDIKNVSGIGDATFEKIKDLLTV